MRTDDGYSTIISICDGVVLYETSTKPPGISGGGAINTTTHRNTAWRTKAPKKLKELSDAGITVAYDTQAHNTILASIQVNQLITVTFPDGGTYAFWGWVESFEPEDFEEGERPTAALVVIPSNVNASNVETPPVYTAPV